MTKLLSHGYIVATVLLTVYSQLIMRWQVSLAGELPATTVARAWFVGRLLLNPWVLSGVVATFLAGVSWMLAMTRFEISYAFPFISLNYIIVLIAGYFIFGESFSSMKMTGTVIVVIGLLVVAKG